MTANKDEHSVTLRVKLLLRRLRFKSSGDERIMHVKDSKGGGIPPSPEAPPKGLSLHPKPSKP